MIVARVVAPPTPAAVTPSADVTYEPIAGPTPGTNMAATASMALGSERTASAVLTTGWIILSSKSENHLPGFC